MVQSESEDSTAPLVLIVDDSETIRNAMATYLEAVGYRTVTADHGVRGYDLARTLQPALVMLDITMPGLDGFEVAGMLKANESTRDTPIIFFTGHAEKAAILRGLREGADDYIAKPFDLDVMAERVTAVLRRTGAKKEEP